jgi:predicted  nucleic acid-binding Zn-ribbon protein
LEQQILTLRQESSGSGPSVGSGSLSTSARDAHLAREIATLNEALNNLKKELESTQSQHLTREQELGTLVKFLQGEIQAKDAKIKVLESEKDLRAERR